MLLGVGTSGLAKGRMRVNFGLRGFFRGFDLLDHFYQFGKR
jgi:hypothetical protein